MGKYRLPDTQSPLAPSNYPADLSPQPRFCRMDAPVHLAPLSHANSMQTVTASRPRKRTRRACDKCSSLRVRCDGDSPCRRCQEYDHECHYARDIRKRGRKPSVRPEHGNGSDIHDESLADEQHHMDYDIVYSERHLQAHAGTTDHVSTFTEGHESLDGENLQSRSPFLQYRNDSYETVVQQPGREKDGNNAQVIPTSVDSPPELPRRTSQFMQDISSVLSPPLPTDTQVVVARHERQSLGASSVSSFRPIGLKDPSLCRSPLKCLEPVLPLLEGIIGADEACELLEFYFDEAGSSLFRVASPYVLTHVLRKQSLLHPTKPRETTSALLVTMLWVSAQTADIAVLLIPGSRPRICDALRRLWMELLEKRDRDHWHRAPGGHLVYQQDCFRREAGNDAFHSRESEPPAQAIDDVLTFILLSIVVSGGDFKTDCIPWWSKAIRSAQSLGLNRQDERCNGSNATCVKISCASHKPKELETVASIEAQEERRRVFWMLFCLDRHLSLSFNATMAISDDEIDVFSPLPDEMWDNLESLPLELLTRRTYGPSTTVTGIGFFEYFLPLMAILGDITLVHHLKNHPRLGSLDEQSAISSIESLLANCARSVSDLANRYELEKTDGSTPAGELLTPSPNDGHPQDPSANKRRSKSRTQAQLVIAYATFILHVLHVLLHGKWDAVSMLENDDGWITSVEFMKCAFHAIAASEAVSQILRRDPELTFMPYLFGIYLLHGSFILLLFADRMPQLGPNESVEKACETIIRAHEVCVVTLNTEFQKRFRKVLRSTLYSVRSAGPTSEEEIIARRRALSLYRWTKGARGLAL